MQHYSRVVATNCRFTAIMLPFAVEVTVPLPRLMERSQRSVLVELAVDQVSGAMS